MGPYALNSTIEKVDTSEAPLVEPTGSLHDLLSFLKKFDVAKKKKVDVESIKVWEPPAKEVDCSKVPLVEKVLASPCLLKIF